MMGVDAIWQAEERRGGMAGKDATGNPKSTPWLEFL
jgi:hypothetical protein